MIRLQEFLPYERVPREMLDDPEIRERFVFRYGENNLHNARFDPKYDLDIMSDEQVERFRRRAEQRIRYARDLRRAWAFGRMDYPDVNLLRSGASMTQRFLATWGRAVGIGGSRESFRYRFGGGPADVREWTKAIAHPTEFLPSRSSAKFLLLASGGAGLAGAPIAYQAGMGAFYNYLGNRDFEDF